MPKPLYVAREILGELRTDSESLDLRWYEYDQLPSNLAGPITRWIAINFEQILKM